MIINGIKTLASLTFPLTLNLSSDPDTVSKSVKTVQEADYGVLQDETGWDRLKRLFQKDDFERISPELHSIFQTACMSTFIGALYGGIVNSRETYIDFMKNNQATAFRDHLEAKKRLQDKVTLSFGKGAFRWGWRLTLFSTTYVTISTCLATYRGKNGIIEHLIAGGTAGILYKFQMGPRGWLIGSGLGIVLGGITGVMTVSLLKLTGMTMEDVRYWNYKWSETRKRSFNEGLNKQLEEEHLQLLIERNKTLGNIGLEGVNVEKQK